MTIFHDERFVDIDLTLKRGGHINNSNLVLYGFLEENFDELERFYDKFGASLYRHPDNFFYIVIKRKLLQTRLLPRGCIHVGLFIALKARDPEITRASGKISISQLLQDIETSVPREVLLQIYAPKKREANADESITDEIKKSIKILAELQCIELTETFIKPLSAINRFSELARYENAPDDINRSRLTADRGIVFIDHNDDDESTEHEQ